MQRACRGGYGRYIRRRERLCSRAAVERWIWRRRMVRERCGGVLRRNWRRRLLKDLTVVHQAGVPFFARVPYRNGQQSLAPLCESSGHIPARGAQHGWAAWMGSMPTSITIFF
ncbi:hypothetical protein K469DRAFT_252221 [Zopfia rhizophila CBS 207.26]|uniref:Uncharacterized protein n=1 Tax=Zopfia rhizophila CBS 207.26 TaxID=1314779 RepID=A0A6A6DT78_9PEZI|nr:hypothetical protein K469DRAFT_252221 [Zopfia rhizophila CBS 207.26]